MSTRVIFEGAGVDLVADRRGDPADPSVLFLHGGGQTRHSWGRTADVLAGHGWCTYTIDARGHGESDWAADRNYRLGAFADDLVAVIDSLDQPPALVGASLGGLTSILAIGRDRPDLARGLVLVDIVPEMDKDGTDRIGEFMTANMRHGFGSLEEAAQAVAAYNPHRPKPPDPEGLRKNLRERDGRWFWHWDPAFIDGAFGDLPSEVMNTDFLMDCAARIPVPVLVVRGRMSDVVTEEAARRFVHHVPNGRYSDVAEAAHMVAGDRNDAFTTEVDQFLEEVH